MAILASLPGFNLFSSLPSKPPPNDASTSAGATSKPPSPPIPIPKYPPKPLKSRNPPPTTRPQKGFPKPVSDGVISSAGDRAVIIGDSGVSFLLPGAPFEYQFSYSETPNVKPLAIREPAFLPFAPPTMPRPWTGKSPLKKKSEKKRKKIPLLEPLNPPPPGAEGAKHLEMRRAITLGRIPEQRKAREEIIGEPLTREEITTLVKPHLNDNRQVNLGRDGLTHNMLELIHSHWKRRPVCKVRCKGIPTVDMDNVCRHLEEKTEGKIIRRVGGVVYLFRGRNYDHQSRPQYPLMLWKPAAPVYPKLIQEAPDGLSKDEADELRRKGKKLMPLYRLAKNGVYMSLVKDVRDAFEHSTLVKVSCKGMDPSDYKKLGAKLKDLVPCVLLSFDDEQILMWRGQEWKSKYRISASPPARSDASGINIPVNCDGHNVVDAMAVTSSPRLMTLWKQALEASSALLLDEICLGPDELLKKVEEFEVTSKAAEQSSHTAKIPSSEDDCDSLVDHEAYSPPREDYDEDYDEDGFDIDYKSRENELFESEQTVPYGSLPVDAIAEQLGRR